MANFKVTVKAAEGGNIGELRGRGINIDSDTAQRLTGNVDVDIIGSVNTNIEGLSDIAGVEIRDQASNGSNKKEKCYDMKSNPRGLCYIFNIKNFENPELQRLGSDVDKDRMKAAFEKLKFEVVLAGCEDSEADVMRQKMEDASKVDHGQYDCFVAVFMSHGNEGVIKGADNEWLKIDDITGCFTSDKCPTLEGKPKLFFFASCRGKDFQKVSYDGPDAESVKTTIPQLSAPAADFLLGYGTVKGKKAVRMEETGTWYIEELAKTLQEDSENDDLATMLTTVAKRVDKRQIEQKECTLIKQTAEYSSTLTKKLYFK